MTGDWARLGSRLKAARVLRGLEQQDVGTALGKSRGAIANIELGKIKSISATVIAYARLVGWAEDSVEKVLAGGNAVMRDEEARAPDARVSQAIAGAPPAPNDLSLRVLQALAEGPLIDSQVITVPTEGGDVKATIVVRGEPDASPEGLHQMLLAWRAKEPTLRQLDDEDERDVT